MVAFATVIRSAGQSGSFNEDEAKEAFLELARDTIPRLEVEIKKSTERERSDKDSTKGSVLYLIDGHDVAMFLDEIGREDLRTEALEELGKLGNEGAPTEVAALVC